MRRWSLAVGCVATAAIPISLAGCAWFTNSPGCGDNPPPIFDRNGENFLAEGVRSMMCAASEAVEESKTPNETNGAKTSEHTPNQPDKNK